MTSYDDLPTFKQLHSIYRLLDDSEAASLDAELQIVALKYENITLASLLRKLLYKGISLTPEQAAFYVNYILGRLREKDPICQKLDLDMDLQVVYGPYRATTNPITPKKIVSDMLDFNWFMSNHGSFVSRIKDREFMEAHPVNEKALYARIINFVCQEGFYPGFPEEFESILP